MVIHLALSAIHAGHASSTPATSSTRKDLTALSLAVAKSKRVVVVTGAGISCSSGIPDFRSSDGLYALVKSRYPNVVLKGKDLFSAGLFRESESTQLFYTFIAELKRMIDKAQPGPTHKFLKTLDAKGRLLRSYTQNIDGFEERAGLRGHVAGNGKTKKFNAKDTKNVQLHGDIHGVRCVICSANLACSPSYLEAFLTGSPPDCPECLSRSDARLARNARPLAVGNLRPSIVLYDEPHPLGEEIGEICSSDLTKKPDLLVIMGTSLKVHGIKRLVKDFANAVHGLPTKEEDSNTKTQSQPASKPQPPSTHLLTNKKPRLVVFVNRTPPPADLAHIFDYWVEGETDAWVQKVEADWRHARPQDWEVQTTLYGDTDVKGKPLAEAKNTFQTIKAGVNSKTKCECFDWAGFLRGNRTESLVRFHSTSHAKPGLRECTPRSRHPREFPTAAASACPGRPASTPRLSTQTSS
ncbi:DHS-like NAD/FAD-binding domain-containing protein [Clavulina sp. PMI_390]|nr:DHS-like NAD/FAD-binding domain-containing protein [Clavulina sp. PMI_390]